MQDTSSSSADCIFCKIVHGEIAADTVYEDEHVLAFLDIRPVQPGHTLVIPKVHARNIFDVSDATLSAVAQGAKKIATAVKAALGAEGINITSNNERVAGQLVFHLHLHVIPRYSDDGIAVLPAGEHKGKNTPAIAEKIRAALS